LERHREDFVVQNWAQTEIGKDFDVFREEAEMVGKQHLTDTGPLDILAVSKDGKRLRVIELKTGRATDVAVGQLLRYMGYAQEDLAGEDQRFKASSSLSRTSSASSAPCRLHPTSPSSWRRQSR
jgi:restriction system protein